jgi:hypothetical protein
MAVIKQKLVNNKNKHITKNTDLNTKKKIKRLF